MSTLLLRLAAPLQSWGVDSKFETRRTEREPTKSGVIGLAAAALGLRRDAPLNELNALKFGVRVDQEGRLIRDFHTARAEKTSYVTYRYYLSDAVFLVGLEGQDEEYMHALEYAFHHPQFPLFLGRRSCPPTLPLCLGLRDMPLLKALQEEPWQAAKRLQARLPGRLRLMSDCASDERGGAFIKDVPVSFSPMCRKYDIRAAVQRGYTDSFSVPNAQHDPMAELPSTR